MSLPSRAGGAAPPYIAAESSKSSGRSGDWRIALEIAGTLASVAPEPDSPADLIQLVLDHDVDSITDAPLPHEVQLLSVIESEHELATTSNVEQWDNM